MGDAKHEAPRDPAVSRAERKVRHEAEVDREFTTPERERERPENRSPPPPRDGGPAPR